MDNILNIKSILKLIDDIFKTERLFLDRYPFLNLETKKQIDRIINEFDNKVNFLFQKIIFNDVVFEPIYTLYNKNKIYYKNINNIKISFSNLLNRQNKSLFLIFYENDFFNNSSTLKVSINQNIIIYENNVKKYNKVDFPSITIDKVIIELQDLVFNFTHNSDNFVVFSFPLIYVNAFSI